jgi:hypothetical protein
MVVDSLDDTTQISTLREATLESQAAALHSLGMIRIESEVAKFLTRI